MGVWIPCLYKKNTKKYKKNTKKYKKNTKVRKCVTLKNWSLVHQLCGNDDLVKDRNAAADEARVTTLGADCQPTFIAVTRNKSFVSYEKPASNIRSK